MLIRFVFKNCLSYRDETDFNMLPGSESSNPDHLIPIKQGIEVLPVAALFGANASGKTNLVQAMRCAVNIIRKGNQQRGQRFDFVPFRLDSDSGEQPTSFEFEFVAKGQPYAYGLVLTQTQVLEEWLFEIGDEEVLLFERKQGAFKFGQRFQENEEDLIFLKSEGRGVSDNQPFLTECGRRNVPFFSDAFDWFRHTIQFVFPKSRYGQLEADLEDEVFKSFLETALNIADLGISGVDSEEVDLDKDLAEELEKRFKEDPSIAYIKLVGKAGERIHARIIDGVLKASKIVTYHHGVPTPFDAQDESDGTRRMMDLAPAMLSVLRSGKVFVIDELDRSLHTLLVRRMLYLFLDVLLQTKKGQLIFTTHDAHVLDQDLFRPDEIWFSQKNHQGASELFPLSDFRDYPEDLRLSYLSGRFGATPTIPPSTSLRQGEAHGTA